jgi:hypothetical protein
LLSYAHLSLKPKYSIWPPRRQILSLESAISFVVQPLEREQIRHKKGMYVVLSAPLEEK